MSDSISALLEALKRTGSKGGMSAAAPDATDDMPMSDDDQDADKDAMNAKIVDVLEQTYPTIFAKIMKTVESDTGDTGDDPMGGLGGMGDEPAMASRP